MKRLLLSSLFAAALGFGGTLAVQAEDLWEEADIAAFDSDNWAQDEYGFYDEDFYYETDEQFDNWYEEEAHTDWMGFDDAGDEGWFDI